MQFMCFFQNQKLNVSDFDPTSLSGETFGQKSHKIPANFNPNRLGRTFKHVTQLAFIAAGGATGALLRYWMSSGIHALLGRGFPYGTLTVNIVGSLFMGFLYVFMIERMDVSVEWRAALMIGLLGAFTTFSTFSIETLNLLESGEQLKAALNVIFSVTLCLIGCWLGMIVGRSV